MLPACAEHCWASMSSGISASAGGCWCSRELNPGITRLTWYCLLSFGQHGSRDQADGINLCGSWNNSDSARWHREGAAQSAASFKNLFSSEKLNSWYGYSIPHLPTKIKLKTFDLNQICTPRRRIISNFKVFQTPLSSVAPTCKALQFQENEEQAG